MKPLLQLIRGGKPPRMKFASFGRERDLSLIEQHLTDADLKEKRLAQTIAAHDLNDGIGTLDAFIEATRRAVFTSSQACRDAPLVLMSRIARYHPRCLEIWNELATSPKWNDRFTVASRLYWEVPDDISDRLFNVLRNDKSTRVSAIAVDRYKNRFNERNELVLDKFDPALFDDRVRRGEVKL